jgi:D-glycero-alpha-D-manno-heptose 1-phosphate guanylyltransferase
MKPGMPDTIVLAGGLGTRLRDTVPDTPKCMSPVSGDPFLNYVIRYLHHQGVGRMIFSLGYMHEVITNHLQASFPKITKEFSVEEIPLGTGGGILHTDTLIVMNGDTFFNLDLKNFIDFHIEKNADVTIALKPMAHFSRYGSVIMNKNMQIDAFIEKQYVADGFINGGVYAIRKEWLSGLGLPEKCSFEKDILEIQVTRGGMYGFVSDSFFIDIGIPEDYAKAQYEVPAVCNF